MNLGKALEALKFDNRMRDWNQKQGLVSPEELKKHDEALEDVAARARSLDLDSDRGSRAQQNSPH